MTEKQQRDAARAFVSYWGEHGDEKQDQIEDSLSRKEYTDPFKGSK